MRVSPWCAVLLVVSLLPLQAEAAKKKSHHKKAETTTKVAPPVEAAPVVQSPADFADAFREAMRSKNREQVLAMLAPDLVVFETGYMEATREEYVKNSLSDDADFASVTDYRVLSRGVIGSGQNMTVLTKANIQGIFGDQRVDLEQSETMILRRSKDSWEIVHLHWSAHARQTNDSEPVAQPVPPSATSEPAPATPANSSDLKPLAEPVIPAAPPATPEAKPEELKNP